MGEVARGRDGQFLPGQSGNPNGRPPSKKNQITVLKQDLEIAIRQNVKAKDIEDIVKSMVLLAKDGSVQAAKLILDKTISNAKIEEEMKQEGGGVRVIIENVTVGREKQTIEAEDADYTEIEDDDMSTGASKSAQARDSQEGGGQMVGGVKPVAKAEVANFMGKSGQGDNQTTQRPKGST